MLACTSVTPVTAGNDVVASEAINKPLDGERFEERAAILEFDGGLTRQEAERLALPESPVSGHFGKTRIT